MNRTLWTTLGVAIVASVLLAGGCASPGENLVAAGTVVAEKQSVGGVRVSRVNVYQDGQTLVVDNSLRRSASYRQRSMGHVDVAVLGPDGAILAQKSFRDQWLTCHWSTFHSARLPLVAPRGSTVRVLFHDTHSTPSTGHTPQEWEALWETGS